MKIYTGTGDRGKTSLFSGQRVSKANERIETYGDMDELNSLIGALIASLTSELAELADELEQIQIDTVRGVFESSVPLPVPHDVRPVLLANGKGGRSPQKAGILVFHVEHLGRGVARWIVRPWCELVLTTVLRPGVSCARF